MSDGAERVDEDQVDYSQQKMVDRIKIAEANSIKANDDLRKMMTESVVPLFKTVNIVVLTIVFLAMCSDLYLIVNKIGNAENRLVNSEVIMSLIGAAIVQLGTMMFTISAYLFPKNG